jgi:hypothetical protein
VIFNGYFDYGNESQRKYGITNEVMDQRLKREGNSMFFVVRFVIEWTIWLIFADKKRWRELFLVSIFAGFLAMSTDLLMTVYKLWDFDGSNIVAEVANSYGMYIVVTYLFIQWLPKNRSFWRMFLYWFVWTGTVTLIEWFHLITGHFVYHKWWNLGWSYVSDWVLFGLFYMFHKVFKLEETFGKLDKTEK